MSQNLTVESVTRDGYTIHGLINSIILLLHEAENFTGCDEAICCAQAASELAYRNLDALDVLERNAAKAKKPAQ